MILSGPAASVDGTAAADASTNSHHAVAQRSLHICCEFTFVKICAFR
jgi:hypothetical protein